MYGWLTSGLQINEEKVLTSGANNLEKSFPAWQRKDIGAGFSCSAPDFTSMGCRCAAYQ